MRKQNTDAMEQAKLVRAWNEKHLSGARVTVTLDNGDVRETHTRSPATLLASKDAVIWLEGIAGAYALDRVKAVPTDEDLEAAGQARLL